MVVSAASGKVSAIQLLNEQPAVVSSIHMRNSGSSAIVAQVEDLKQQLHLVLENVREYISRKVTIFLEQ